MRSECPEVVEDLRQTDSVSQSRVYMASTFLSIQLPAYLRYVHSSCLSLDLSHHKGMQTGSKFQIILCLPSLKTSALVGLRGGPQQTVRCVSWGMVFCLEATPEGGRIFKVFSPPPAEEKCTLAAVWGKQPRRWLLHSRAVQEELCHAGSNQS